MKKLIKDSTNFQVIERDKKQSVHSYSIIHNILTQRLEKIEFGILLYKNLDESMNSIIYESRSGA